MRRTCNLVHVGITIHQNFDQAKSFQDTRLFCKGGFQVYFVTDILTEVRGSRKEGHSN